MISFVCALVLLLLSLLGVVLRKTYYYVPLDELKRQATKHNPQAQKIYVAAAYGSSLRALLWLFIVLTSAGGFVLLARIAPVWLSLAVVVLLLFMAYSWLPASRVSRLGMRLTLLATPVIVWLLNWLHPLLSRGAYQVEKRYSADPHTQLYERNDLLKLLERQQLQADSRITPEELDVVRRALSFDERLVRDIVTSRELIKTVSQDDTIGPVLIDELHKTAQPFVLVTGETKNDIVGTLQVSKLGLKSSGQVRDHMQQPVYFLNENDSLATALHAFYTTSHNLFVIINNFEEYLGVITVQSLLEQLLGEAPAADFDDYADRAAVAYRHTDAARAAKAEAIAAKLAEGQEVAIPEEMLPETDETVVE